MLPFNVRNYMKKNNENRSTACAQQSIANQIVLGTMAKENPPQQLQQQPAKQ